MITAEQFAEWKTSPVTIEIFDGLKKIRQELKDKMPNGDTIGLSADQTHGLTNRMVGHIEGLDQILEISFATPEETEEISDTTGY